MIENFDIFGNVTEPPEPKREGNRYKTMQELHGVKEGNDTCKTCDHLYRPNRKGANGGLQ